jgi:RNA polymerase sigma-70 factor (sigma-E family)
VNDAHRAFEQFVRDSGPALLRTATLLTGDREQAQDLLQDALERCLRRWPRADVEYPAAYVRTTMVHLVQRRRLDRFLRRDPLPVADPADARDDIGGVELRQSLLAALRTLPPRRRAVVVLRYWEGYPEAECAALLGCSVGTIKSQAARGLASLRETWGGSPPDRTAPRPPVHLVTTGDLT